MCCILAENWFRGSQKTAGILGDVIRSSVNSGRVMNFKHEHFCGNSPGSGNEQFFYPV